MRSALGLLGKIEACTEPLASERSTDALVGSEIGAWISHMQKISAMNFRHYRADEKKPDCRVWLVPKTGITTNFYCLLKNLRILRTLDRYGVEIGI